MLKRLFLAALAFAASGCSVAFQGKATMLSPLNRETASSDVASVNRVLVAKAMLEGGVDESNVVASLRREGVTEDEAERIVTAARALCTKCAAK